MKTECPHWALPLLAVQFLTRIPIPAVSSLSREAVLDGLKRAVIWFPFVGSLIGAITALTIILVEQWWPRLVAVLIALVVEARLTGAFHEDAVADFCDAVGGGNDPEHAREIMKDSRIGTYGSLALLLGVGLRVALTCLLPAATLLVGVVGAATVGRLLAVMVMASVSPVASSNTLAKDVGGRVSVRYAAWAFALASPGLLPLVWAAPFAVLTIAAASMVFITWFRRLLMMHIGGSTGDCLGFATYAGQLVVLFVLVAA
ncbi:adenosylcobinamide-GDP ribazoletransferase [Steroidobacter denitrificans]|uniref:adenosylcobinamide-GDP ribazoletransferase n=1 Tax=Steroidobacter denitrificans TaxID=465721 RepID=UPI001AEFA2E8|nr:adenosylcobinamide-GDP ribazoletransferase [Steroidobacter denitrificans]